MVVSDLRSNLVKSKLTEMTPKETKDAKTLRRIIAEDPDWSLATVPLLKDIAINHIVKNFQGCNVIFYSVILC